jgi:hypothetical protein
MCHKRFRDMLHTVASAKPPYSHKRHGPRRKSTAKPTSVKLPPTITKTILCIRIALLIWSAAYTRTTGVTAVVPDIWTVMFSRPTDCIGRSKGTKRFTSTENIASKSTISSTSHRKPVTRYQPQRRYVRNRHRGDNARTRSRFWSRMLGGLDHRRMVSVFGLQNHLVQKGRRGADSNGFTGEIDHVEWDLERPMRPNGNWKVNMSWCLNATWGLLL